MENEELVKTICPRCNGNGYIRIAPVIAGVFDKPTEHDCPMCENQFDNIGMRVSTHNGYVMLPKSQTRINICLLYTSPSPRDYPGSRMPSSA